MDQAQIDAMKNRLGGSMTPEQVAQLRDMQGFIEFCIRNGISHLAALSTLAHDVNGLLTHQDAKWFRPKSAGYARINEELREELEELAREQESERKAG
jgi:hypothetical protein